MNKAKWIGTCMAAGVVFFFVAGLATMLLWNWLVPDLFGGPELRFLEAVGLLALAKILFGGWAAGRCRGGRQHGWKHRYQAKLAAMSPEDRERFKSRMREKWRCGERQGGPDDSPAANG